MKRIWSVVLALVMLLSLVPMGAFTLTANAETSGYYTYSVSGGKATITDVNTSISGAVAIPSTLGGYPVTSIGEYAFSRCGSLTSVTIPDSVTSIGYRAFYSCDSLTSVTIGNGVTSIGDSVFSDCGSLTSVTIPNSVTRIENYAFGDCDSLTSITIPDSVTRIGDSAFGDCDSLTSITIPDSVTRIGYSAFYSCDSLTSVTIPDSVTRIGDDAFGACDSLTSIMIPDSVTSIGYGAFTYCNSLANITVEENNPNYCSVDGVLFTKDQTTLLAYPAGKTATSYTIPNSVTSIELHAFEDCTSLTSVKIPNSVTRIGDRAFAWCDNLTSVTIPDSVTSIGEWAFRGCYNLTDITIYNGMTVIGNEAIEKKTTIYGYVGSTAEEYALANGNTFYNIDTYNDYYEDVGQIAIVTRNKNGTTLSGCTITVGDQQYVANGHTTFIDIPEEYTGDITVSKDGYITSALSVEMLKKYNFFVMYPDTETTPITQHYLLRDANSSSNGYVDLLRSSEYIYDLGNKKHDIYIDVNPNGHTVKNIYLLQGKQKVMLKNGMNYDINSNGLFNSDGGTIYLCIETSDGTIYKTNSKIVAAKTRVTLDADIQGAVSGVVDEELSAVGGMSYTGKFKLGDLPVSITIEENKVKGTIGIKGSEQSTATWYEAISGTIKKHEDLYGNEEYDSETIEELEKGLKDSGGDIVEGYSSFGIDVNGSIIGYIEANWNPVTCKLEDIQIGMILKIAGEASYTQQSSFVVVSVPIPYYWTVEFGIELAAKIGGKWEYGANDKVDFSVEMPELSIGVELTGSLCLGLDKIVGGGGKVKGGLEVTFNAPDYSFTTSVWELSYDIALTGQIAGFSGDLSIKDGIYQIYPQEKAKSVAIMSKNLMSDYAQSSVLMASAYSLRASTYLADNSTENDSNYTFKSNGYTYASPTVAVLSDGTAVMVWVDYDNDRRNVNKTALYYSVYSPRSESWCAPVQVEDDGTADDFPVLKTIDDTVYLVWNDADNALPDDATMLDMLSSMGVSYAAFDKRVSAFSSVSNVSGDNDCMDLGADFTIVDGKPTVVWLKNDANDIFGQSGKNIIMSATYNGTGWERTVALETTAPINSVTVVEDDLEPTIYYSADVDSDIGTFDDYEIFKLCNGQTVQVTDNMYADTAVTSYANTVYWLSDGVLSSETNTFACEDIENTYVVAEDEDGLSSVIYTIDNADGTVDYMLYAQTEDGYGEPVRLMTSNYACGGMAAYWQGQTLILTTNEINMEDFSSSIKVYEFVKGAKLLVDSAYYDRYTLMEGGQLRTTVTVKNNGNDLIEGYSVYAYADETLLSVFEVNSVLLPGQAVDHKIFVDLPEQVTFDQIDFSIKYNSRTSEIYSLPLALTDVSLENAVIVSDENSAQLSVSVVNRGINDLSDVTVHLRRDTEDGKILDSYAVASIASREEQVVSFDVSQYADDTTRYYITTDIQDGENNIANNSDFAISAIYEPNEVVIENIFDSYERIITNQTKTATLNSDKTEILYIFTPDEDGYYSFYSYNNDHDTYGYILDADMNELSYDDDGGDDSNFKVKYHLEAGATYLLKARFYNTSNSGSFTVTVGQDDHTHIYDNDCDTTCNVLGCTYTRVVSGHTYDKQVVANKYLKSAATCSSAAVYYKSCKCGAKGTATFTSGSKLSHKYTNACDTTCNTCGAKRTIKHTYTNACDTSCNVCKATRTITHNYAAATCTKAKTCKVCGATSGKALGHKYTNACDTTCNTCGAKRTIKHTYTNACDTSCNVCKATRSITHTYKTTTTKATLTKNGSTVKKCSVCGKVASNTAIKYPKTFKLSTTAYTYNGGVKTPTVTVKDSAGKTLKKNTDYTVTYASGRKNVGTYKVTVKMIGKYSGTKTLTFKINPAKLSSYKLSATAYTYNGSVKSPSVTVKNANGTTLTKNTHYTVTYASGRKNVGTYKVTIKGKGNYTGTKTLTFKINPPKTTVSKVTPASKSLKVTVAKKTTQTTGYQVQYSTSKSFKTVKNVYLSNKTTNKTITGLKAKTTYYVRVRTYKKVGSKSYCSGWSTAKSAKTK